VRGSCPKVFDTVVSATGTDIVPFAGGDYAAPKPFEGMTPDELGRRLRLAKLVSTWLTGLKAYAYASAMRGDIPTGHKVVKANTKRRFKNPDLAARQAARVFVGDIVEEDMWSQRAITPAAFERLVGKKRAANFLSEYAERPEKLTLAPIEDKREAVPVGAASEFEPIGDLTADAD